jgi:hypothetical protein
MEIASTDVAHLRGFVKKSALTIWPKKYQDNRPGMPTRQFWI